MSYRRYNSHATHCYMCQLLEIPQLHDSVGLGHTWFPDGLIGPQLRPGDGAGGFVTVWWQRWDIGLYSAISQTHNFDHLSLGLIGLKLEYIAEACRMTKDLVCWKLRQNTIWHFITPLARKWFCKNVPDAFLSFWVLVVPTIVQIKTHKRNWTRTFPIWKKYFGRYWRN